MPKLALKTKEVSMLSTNVKEILTRYAKGSLAQMPDELVDIEVAAILDATQELRKSLGRIDVLSALIRQYPQSVYVSADDKLDNDALIHIAKNELTKQNLIKFDAEISEALLRKRDDPTYDWNNLLDKLLNTFSKAKVRENYVMLNKVSFAESKVVASFGIPELDKYCGGGIGVGSITVFYAPVNIGKTTLVTRNMAARLIEQGKRPLIVSLEGDPNKLAIKIISQLLGFATTDIKDFNEFQKAEVLKKAEDMPELPVVSFKASKKWEILKLIRTYEPDVILYDQLTIAAGGRDWQEMAKISSTLKGIAAETGIPIVALTQSSEKNYHGANKTDKEKEADGDEIGTIKYGQSILEDADNVIHIAKVNFKPNVRRMTIVKTRDDSSAGLLPIKFEVEYTDKGLVSLASNSGSKHGENGNENTLPKLKI